MRRVFLSPLYFSSFQYKSWTCITKQECSSRQVSGFTLSNMLADSEEAESFYKVYDGQCVEKCPAGYEPRRNKQDNIWNCTVCKKDCPVNCDGEIINSRESALKLKSCTHIKGDIVINVISGDITPVLEETLRDIKDISGSLKIERSHSLVSLQIFPLKFLFICGHVPLPIIIFRVCIFLKQCPTSFVLHRFSSFTCF